ncbi:DUF1697 domain-containing protein, partial [Nocardioides sp.]|uniref:DUF1697 domain-containing protein n=1 Tax=Nocardioides sp. TaxID=35761 RepID=UPI002B273819
MSTCVAFLRAINLGAKRKFPKDDVVAVTEAAGFTGVTTHLNTGNVRLETALRSRAKIEAALEAAYLDDRGFEVPTMVYACADLVEVAAEAARLGEGHTGKQFVSLLKAEPDAGAAAALEARSTEGERAIVSGRAVHLLLGEAYREATISNAVVERHLGVATNRSE